MIRELRALVDVVRASYPPRYPTGAVINTRRTREDRVHRLIPSEVSGGIVRYRALCGCLLPGRVFRTIFGEYVEVSGELPTSDEVDCLLCVAREPWLASSKT